MTWLVQSMKWIMFTSGFLTCTMIYAAIAPQAALNATFGEAIDGPVADLVVRNWGVLIALVGGMLMYGAFNLVVRPLVLTVAGLSKVTFIGLLMIGEDSFLDHQAGVAIFSDLVQVVLFAAYLLAVRTRSAESTGAGT